MFIIVSIVALICAGALFLQLQKTKKQLQLIQFHKTPLKLSQEDFKIKEVVAEASFLGQRNVLLEDLKQYTKQRLVQDIARKLHDEGHVKFSYSGGNQDDPQFNQHTVKATLQIVALNPLTRQL